MTPDINVLVSAYRSDHPHHNVARRWLEEALRQAALGRISLTLLGSVLSGFLSTTTHPHIFHQVDQLEDVCYFIDCLMSCPGVQCQAPSASWSELRQLCLSHQISGYSVSDTWIAATVLQSGETLCTFDRNFLRLLPSDQLILLKP